MIGGPDTFATREGAAAAEEQARTLLRSNARTGVTLGEFWNDWTTDPLWMRPAESTNIHRRERTAKFVAKFGHLPIRAIDDEHVAACDALRWDRIDFQTGTIVIDQQWNAKVRKFTPPKHGVVRTIALTDSARDRLLRLPHESEFAFSTLLGHALHAVGSVTTGTAFAAAPGSATSTSTWRAVTTSAGTR